MANRYRLQIVKSITIIIILVAFSNTLCAILSMVVNNNLILCMVIDNLFSFNSLCFRFSPVDIRNAVPSMALVDWLVGWWVG